MSPWIQGRGGRCFHRPAAPQHPCSSLPPTPCSRLGAVPASQAPVSGPVPASPGAAGQTASAARLAAEPGGQRGLSHTSAPWGRDQPSQQLHMAGHTDSGKNSTRAALHNMGVKVTQDSCAKLIPSPALLQRGAGPSCAPRRASQQGYLSHLCRDVKVPMSKMLFTSERQVTITILFSFELNEHL